MVERLRQRIRSPGAGAIHALWTLQGLGQLDRDSHQFALLTKDAGLKRNAIKALGTDPDSLQLFFDSAVVSDKDPQVRLAAFAKLADFPESETISRAANEFRESVKANGLKATLRARDAKFGDGRARVNGPELRDGDGNLID